METEETSPETPCSSMERIPVIQVSATQKLLPLIGDDKPSYNERKEVGRKISKVRRSLNMLITNEWNRGIGDDELENLKGKRSPALEKKETLILSTNCLNTMETRKVKPFSRKTLTAAL